MDTRSRRSSSTGGRRAGGKIVEVELGLRPPGGRHRDDVRLLMFQGGLDDGPVIILVDACVHRVSNCEWIGVPPGGEDVESE